jgi:hypothetical protein
MRIGILNADVKSPENLVANHKAFAFKNRIEYSIDSIENIDEHIVNYDYLCVLNRPIVFLNLYKNFTNYHNSYYSITLGLQEDMFTRDNSWNNSKLSSSCFFINNNDWIKNLLEHHKSIFYNDINLNSFFDKSIDMETYWSNLQNINILRHFFILPFHKMPHNDKKINNYFAMDISKLDNLNKNVVINNINTKIGILY